MKKVLCIVIAFIAMGFIACDKKESGSGGAAGIKNGTISGKIKIIEEIYNEEGYDYSYQIMGDVTDEVDEIKVYIDYYDNLKTASVSNGSFSFKLPTPSSEYLYEFIEEIEDLEELNEMGFTISDMDVKIADISLYCSKNDEVVSYLGLMPLSLKENIDVEVIYVDRDVIMKGTYTEQEDGYMYIGKWDINFKKGWNTIVSKEVIKGNIETYTITANDEPPMLWVMEISEYPYDFKNGAHKGKKNSFKDKFKLIRK